MADHRRHALSAFAGDHRKFVATKGAFAPTLRIKALAAAVLTCLMFWGVTIYLIVR